VQFGKMLVVFVTIDYNTMSRLILTAVYLFTINVTCYVTRRARVASVALTRIHRSTRSQRERERERERESMGEGVSF